MLSRNERAGSDNPACRKFPLRDTRDAPARWRPSSVEEETIMQAFQCFFEADFTHARTLSAPGQAIQD